ncbi:MAG: anthranilate phosphoribosyltransferase [Nannocystaceae bacterium]
MQERASAIRAGLGRLAAGERPGRSEITAVFREIMAGEAEPAQTGALLMGINLNGITTEAIAGAAAAMREAVIAIPCTRTPVIDTCGTGGSGIPRRNVSTAVALAVAACGVAVAKHGNRGISSPSGSADVLERLGVDITVAPEVVGRCIDTLGVGFLFAQRLHPAMKHAGPTRRALGIRTLFNLLGPLTNPAGVRRQVVGVFDPCRCKDLASALGELGSERVFVVHGFRPGHAANPTSPACIDDLSPDGESLVAHMHRQPNGETVLETRTLCPADAGLPATPLAELAGGTPAENAQALRELLDGAPGAYRTAVQYSGALSLLVAGDAPLAKLPELAHQIGEVLDNGQARGVLDALVDLTQGA